MIESTLKNRTVSGPRAMRTRSSKRKLDSGSAPNSQKQKRPKKLHLTSPAPIADRPNDTSGYGGFMAQHPPSDYTDKKRPVLEILATPSPTSRNDLTLSLDGLAEMRHIHDGRETVHAFCDVDTTLGRGHDTVDDDEKSISAIEDSQPESQEHYVRLRRSDSISPSLPSAQRELDLHTESPAFESQPISIMEPLQGESATDISSRADSGSRTVTVSGWLQSCEELQPTSKGQRSLCQLIIYLDEDVPIQLKRVGLADDAGTMAIHVSITVGFDSAM